MRQTEPKIIVPNQRLAQVYRQTNMGVHAYDEDDLYTPDTDLWRSKMLDLRLYEYPPNNTYVFDRSRYNNHGTVTGATWGIQGRTFDPVDDYISVPNPSQLNFERTDPFSVTVWFKRPATNSSGFFASKQTGATTYRGWYVYMHSINYTLGFNLRSDNATGNALQVDSVPTYGSNLSPICFTATYDGSSSATGVLLYVNGLVVADTDTTNALTATTLNTANFNIGARNNVAPFTNGMTVREEIVHKRRLSAGEVAYIHQATKG